MGYSPLRTGFAFLPFSVGIVGAGIASNLSSEGNPHWVAGTGTALAGVALRCSCGSASTTPSGDPAAAATGGHLGSSVNSWTDLFPFIVPMAPGMGLTFVPMTLAAVHRVDHRDSGVVGSGLLNTMQQVGGALGLATPSTVAVSTRNDISKARYSRDPGASSSGALADLIHPRRRGWLNTSAVSSVRKLPSRLTRRCLRGSADAWPARRLMTT